MSQPRVFFYVQHLLGIGHTVRAAALTRAMRRLGLDVVYVSGGFDALDDDLAGAVVHRLPPVRSADASYTTLLGEGDTPIDDAWRDRRRDALLAAYRETQPDVVLIETFPFGRWPFRFELLPLLQEARGAARILCSLRDVLVPKTKPSRLKAIVEMIETYFDAILVHGDPEFVRLDETFAPASRIAAKLHYTGYVADPVDAPQDGAGAGEVVVSAGGGGTGGPMMRTALAAHALTSLADAPWRFLIGPNMPRQDAAALKGHAGIIVEPVRADFPALLSRAAVSVSQGGYNTVMDILTAGARSIVVPFNSHGQSEQLHRARLLAARGGITLVEEEGLTPETLAAAIDRAVAGPRARPDGIDLGGARRSAELIAAAAA